MRLFLKSKIPMIAVIGLVIAITNYINAAENILWNGNPIQIQVEVGTERRIDFPEPIVDINMSVTESKVSNILLTPEGRLFFKPTAVYKPARLKVVSVTGTLYLVDIESKETGSNISNETIVIIDPLLNAAGASMAGAGTGSKPTHIPMSNTPNKVGINGSSQSNQSMPNNPNLNYLPDFLRKDMTGNDDASQSKSSSSPDFIAMSRYAMAHFAGPKRLIPNIQANKVAVKQPHKNWLRVMNNSLDVRALAQWSISGYYVTAIYVRNKSDRGVEFDPRGIRGEISFVGAMHTYIEPRGQNGDEGLWAVVTKQPFNIAIKQ